MTLHPPAFMLSILKKFFTKPEPMSVGPVAAAAVPVPQPPPTPVPSVEVAHLSLAAIVGRFPEELKTTLLRAPDDAATVALPLQTILKQLPAANVKMSLASLHRQAPGIFQPLEPGDKRMIEVPLAEVFRHVRPHMFRRRPDQRPFELPDNGFTLFGNSQNPYAIAPDAGAEEPAEPEPTVLDLTPETPEAPRMLKMDAGLREHFSGAASARSMLVATASPASPRVLAPPAEFSNAAAAALPATSPIASSPDASSLSLKLVKLAGDWPESIRAEVESLDPATNVALPMDEVSAGLARGRVAFPWAKIRAWLEPQPAALASTPDEVELILPLKVVAPAFLAATKKPATERKRRTVDESIPALFNNVRAEVVVETPVVEPIAPSESPAEARAPKVPETVGEVFGQPDKQEWMPSEIVAQMVGLPGVAGAIVTLQEGLQVATSLPESMKSETVAAFLPQIFARLNQYAGEMKLGDVDDLLFTTHGAHCQIFRLGYVYFAVLGKPGEPLPWHELRLIADELARQTNK